MEENLNVTIDYAVEYFSGGKWYKAWDSFTNVDAAQREIDKNVNFIPGTKFRIVKRVISSEIVEVI